MAARRQDPIPAGVWRIAAVVVLGSIASILDTTIVNVALETLGRELGASISGVQWVATAYLLSLATAIPLTGWAARRFGPKQVYLVALALFTGGSVLCAVAWDLPSLIGFRVLQGLGGGMVLPLGQVMLASAAGPQRMGRVMSIVGVPMILAPIFGPVIGGAILDAASWHWIFLVNLPIGLLAMAAAWRVLDATDRAGGGGGALDVRGLVLAGVGVPALIYGLSEIGATGEVGTAQVLLPIAAGLVLLAAFVAHATRAEHPLLDVALYREPSFRAASLTTFALGGALFGSMILMPLYFQGVRDEGVATTGWLLAPQGVGVMLAMPLAGRLTDRGLAAPVALVGVALTMLGTVPFALLSETTSYWTTSLAQVVRGLGIGLAMMPAMTAAYASLRPDQLTDAAPQLNVLQRTGGSIGTALLAVVLQRALEGVASRADAAAAYGTAFWVAIGVTALALPPVLVLLRTERRARAAARATTPVPAHA